MVPESPPPSGWSHPGAPPPLPELPEGGGSAPPPVVAPATEPARAPLPWPAWMAPVALVAAFGVTFTGAILIAGVAAATGGSLKDQPPAVVILSTAFQDLALIGTALVFARLAQHGRPADFGLRIPRFWRSVGWVALAYVAFLVVTAAWLAIMQAFGVNVDDSNELPSELGADESTVALVAVGVLVTIIAPIAEEFFFRGFFFTALRSWKGVPLAALITGLVFGAIHAGSSPAAFLVPLALFGVVLCLLYVRTGSLLPSISLHAINNSVAFGVSQHWTWQVPLVAIAALLVIGAILIPISKRNASRPPITA